MKFGKHYTGKRAIAIAAAAVVAMTAVPAGAIQPAEAESMSADGYVTAAATRAAQTAPEILGLTGVEETSGSTGAAGWGTLDWKTPKYNIFGQTSINTAANPYMVNAVRQKRGKDGEQTNADISASPTIVLNEARAGGGAGPMGSLAPYEADETDDEVWNIKPDIVIGNQSDTGTVNYDTESYLGDLYDEGYHPKGVAYYSGENANIIKEMYAIAKAADQVAADSNGAKKLRYGNATEIAKNYEEYVRGTQGLILKAISEHKVEKKTIALVNAYDAGSNSYKLTATGAKLSGSAAGTSEVDHYLDMTNPVTDNLANKLGKTTVKANELSKADAIIVGGNGVNSKSVASTLPESLLSKTYYTDGYNAGAIYDVMHNAVDNVQNAGRILGFVYPEVVDQDDWVCYYYDHFYHVKTGELPGVIDKAMDGVRNEDAKGAANYLQWDESDASTYKSDEVQKKLDEGMAYSDQKAIATVKSLVEKISKKAKTTQAEIDELTAAYETISQPQKDAGAVPGYESALKSAKEKLSATSDDDKGKDTSKTLGLAKGKSASWAGNTYKVTANSKTASKAAVTLTRAKNSKTVTVPSSVKLNGRSYRVTAIGSGAFSKAKKATSVTVGKYVKTISKNAFKSSKVKALTVKSSGLTKKSVKGSLKSSQVKTVKVKIGSKKTNKRYVTKYKKIFTKANAGKRAKVY